MEIAIFDADGMMMARGETDALNNVGTVVEFSPPVKVAATRTVLLRVTNRSSVILGYCCAPSPPGYEQALAYRGFSREGPLAKGIEIVSLTGVIHAVP